MNAQNQAAIAAINAAADAKIAELAKDSAKYADNMGEFLAKMNAINDERNKALKELLNDVPAQPVRQEKRWYQNEALQVTAGLVGGFTLLMFGTMVGTGAGVAVSRKVFGVDLAQQPVLLVDNDGNTAHMQASVSIPASQA